MTSVACKYFVQNEGEEEICSNLFILSKKYQTNEKVKFKDVMAEFPLAYDGDANYHLRFQTFLPESPGTPIWIDILREEAHVPLIEPGLIRIKALRLPPGLQQKFKHSRPVAPNEVPSYVPKPPEKQVVSDSESDGEYDVDEPEQSPEEKKSRTRIDSETQRELFNIDLVGSSSKDEDFTPSLQPRTYPTYSESQPQPTSKPAEQKPTSSQEKAGAQFMAPKPAEKSKLAEERANEKLLNYRKQQEKEEKLKEEWDKARELYEEKVANWIGKSGVKNSIRTLLQTIQDVAWPGCEWVPISLGDVLSNEGVKKYHKKAVLMFHPDKAGRLNDSHKEYIASRIFNGLSEAYKEYIRIDSKGSSK